MRIGLVVLGLILALGTPALAHEDGVLHLGSRSVAEGAELQVRGEKLPVDAMIRLELRGTLESFLLGEFRTDAAGVFETRLSLPAEAAAGSYTVMAFAPDGDEVARTEIVVLAAPDAGETPGDVGMTPAPGQAGLHATHEMMDLPVTRSWGEWAVILGLIAFGAAVGLALLRGRPTAAGLYAGSED